MNDTGSAFTNLRRVQRVVGLAATLCLLSAISGRAAERFVLAQGGKATAAIVVGEDAGAASLHTAEALREMLGKMSGATFAIERGDGMSGIAVGTAGEFPALANEAARYALDYFAKNPEQPSVPMEPTDGSGWCGCAACAKVGQPSERVALLANSAGEALEKPFPKKYVGILAYRLHADPPSRKLHPRVAVSLATALSSSRPLVERLADWAKVSENLGIYEYLSVMEWHLGLPAKSLAGNVPRLAETIPA